MPTYSALDVPYVTSTTVYSKYINNVTNNPTLPRIATYIAQGNEPGIGSLNASHIRFTARNSEWLFSQMQGLQLPSSFCSTECSPVTNPAITGPLTLCVDRSQNPNATATYTSPLQGAGYTYSWTASPAAFFTVSSGTGPTFQTANVPSNGGRGTITLTVNTGCTYSFTLPVVVGAPEEPVVELQGTACYSTATFLITNYDPGLTYTVQHPGCSMTGSIANGYFALKGGLAATYTVTVRNDCDSTSASGQVNYDPNCGGPHYVVYPNPADNQLTVEQTDSTGTTSTQRHATGTYPPAGAGATASATGSGGSTSTPLFTVRVYNSFGTLQLQQTATTPALDLQTSPLPTGLYAVTIEADGTIVDTRHVQITH